MTTTVVDPAFLADYTGQGVLGIVASQDATLSVQETDPDDGTIFGASDAGLLTDGTVTISYNYTAPGTGPVAMPEPATLGLFGVGLAVLGTALRRRRQRQL